MLTGRDYAIVAWRFLLRACNDYAELGVASSFGPRNAKTECGLGVTRPDTCNLAQIPIQLQFDRPRSHPPYGTVLYANARLGELEPPFSRPEVADARLLELPYSGECTPSWKVRRDVGLSSELKVLKVRGVLMKLNCVS